MPTASTPSASAATESHLAIRALTLDPRSLKDERAMLSRFVEFVRDKQVGRITPDDYARFLAGVRSGELGTRGPVRDSSLARYASKLRGFAAYCQSRGWVRVNPFPAASAGGVRINPAVVRQDYLRLSATELLTMIDSEEYPRDRAILVMGTNTGLRSSEVVSIKLGDVDLDQREFYVVVTKTRVSDRVPISEELDAELRPYLAWYEEKIGEPVTPDMYLFPRRSPTYFAGRDANGERTHGEPRIYPRLPMATKAAREIVTRGLERLGYSRESRQGEGFHTLRRSVARLYFDDLTQRLGYDGALRRVASLLHHKSVQTTELYLGLDSDRVRRDASMKGQPFLSRFAENETPALKVLGGDNGGS